MATASGSSDLAVASWSEPEGHASKSDRYLARRLAAASADYKGVAVTTFLLAACVTAMGWILFGIGLEHWIIAGGLPRWARWTWFIAGLVALAAAIVRWIVPLLRYRVNLVYAARAIEADHPELHNDLVNAVLVKARPDGAAAKVVRSLERRAAKRLARVPNDGVVDRTAAFRLALALAALVVGAGVYELTAPKSLLISGARLIAPWAGLAAPTRVTIGAPRLSWRQPGAAPQAGGDPEGRVLERGDGGSVTLVRGRQLIVTSDIRGLRSDEKATLVVGPIREDGTIDQAAAWRMPMVPMDRGPSGGAGGDPGPPAGGRSARGVRHLVVVPDAVRGLEEDVEFFISAGDASSDRVRIAIVDTPSLLVREVRYEYPAYTRREPEAVAWQGDLRAVEGTRATIVAESNRPLESAWIDLDCDGKRDVELRVGQHDLTRATGAFRLQLKKDRSGPEHGSYRFVFQPIAPQATKAAAAREEPVVEKLEHRIEVVPDLPPEVSIEEPREPVLTVPPGGPVEIRVRATDPDFALAGVAVETRLRGGDATQSIALLSKVHAGVFRGAARVVPETLGAVPGSVLEYRAVAIDTRQDPPNKTASPWQSLRIDASAPPPRQPPPRDDAKQPRQGGNEAAGSTPAGQQPAQPGKEEGRQSGGESGADQKRDGQQGPEGRQDPQAAAQGRQHGEQGGKNESSRDQHGPGQGQQGQGRDQQVQEQQNTAQQNKDQQGKDQQGKDQQGKDQQGKDQQGQGPGGSGQESKSEKAQRGGPGDGGESQGGDEPKGADNKPSETGGGENKTGQNAATENKGGSTGQAGGGKESGGQQAADNAGGGKAGGKQSADGRGAEQGKSGNTRGGGDRAGKPQDTVAADGTNDGEAMERILDHRRRQEDASRQSKQGGGKAAGGEGGEKKPEAAPGVKSEGPNDKPGQAAEQNDPGKGGEKPSAEQSADTQQQPPAACANAEGKPCGKQGCSSCSGGSKPNGGGPGSSGAAGGSSGQESQKDQPGQGQQGQGPQGQSQQGQGQQGQGRNGQGKQGQGQPGQGQQGQGQQGQGDQGQADAGQGSGQKQEGQPGQAEGRGGQGGAQAGTSGEGRPAASGREQGSDGRQGEGKQQASDSGQGKQAQGDATRQKSGAGQQPGPGNEQAGGEQAGKQPNGQRQAGQDQNGKNQSGKDQAGNAGNDQAGDRAAEPGQGKPPAAGDRAAGQSGGKSASPAQPQPDGPQPATGSQVGAGGRTGGRGGSGADAAGGPPPDRDLEWTAEDLAHARNAADLAIEHLRDSVESGRRDVLDALGWTPEQARAFLERWQAMRRSAGSGDPRQRGEFEQTLRSLGLRPGGTRNTRDVPTDIQGGQAEGRRSRPPASYREQLKAYLRGTSGE